MSVSEHPTTADRASCAKVIQNGVPGPRQNNRSIVIKEGVVDMLWTNIFFTKSRNPRWLRLTAHSLECCLGPRSVAVEKILLGDILSARPDSGKLRHNRSNESIRPLASQFSSRSKAIRKPNLLSTMVMKIASLTRSSRPSSRKDFTVLTRAEGIHWGTSFEFRARSEQSRDEWLSAIAQILNERPGQDFCPPVSFFKRSRAWVRRFYFRDEFQVMCALLIGLNFLVNIAEAQILPRDTLQSNFTAVDLFFTCIFTAELAVNMFATLVRTFVRSGWNWFDLFVVTLSWVVIVLNFSHHGSTSIGSTQYLRILRALRVFRLMSNIKGVRKVVTALMAAIPAVSNALGLVCMLTALYSILATNLFRFENEEYFGDFVSAMFTMFQVMTGDNWAVIVRDMYATTDSTEGVNIFFISYLMMAHMILLEVVVAILIDEFSKVHEDENAMPEEKFAYAQSVLFQPILKELLLFNGVEELTNSIRQLYKKVCLAESSNFNSMSAQLDFHALKNGFLSLGYVPPVRIEPSDWEEYVINPGYCNEFGCLDAKGFESLFVKNIAYNLRDSKLPQAVANDTRRNQAMQILLQSLQLSFLPRQLSLRRCNAKFNSFSIRLRALEEKMGMCQHSGPHNCNIFKKRPKKARFSDGDTVFDMEPFDESEFIV